ncbi:MAG: translation initiation factor IF-2 [Muribaculaceae bacterium]|nr:translation initiation factor IF-2 [Muribaculaceae bacterium]
MRTKISKVAKDLNVGVGTVVDFLSRHNIAVENNPNARIDDSAVSLLMNEFSNDKADKQKVDGNIQKRKDAKKEKSQRNEQAGASASQAPGLKVLGKIDLDATRRGGKPSRPAQQSAPKPAEPKPAPEKKDSAAKPAAPAPAPEQKETQQKKPVKTEPENISEKRKEEKNNRKNEEEHAKTPSREASEPKVEAHKEESNSQEEGENGVFRLNAPADKPELKVLGKIDLSSLNQSTRPKKRGKEDRRRGDKNRQGGNAAAAPEGNSDRKKRKRIGKEKIDIEKAASQPGFGADRNKKKNSEGKQGQGSGNAQGGKNRDRKNEGGQKNRRNDRQQKQETSQEDVQKQVKETLARLTNKAPKKGLKWRKEKKEAIHNRELEDKRREEAESKVIQLTEFVTANDLANLMEVPVNNVIATCMNLGVMVSINQRLDAETINIVAEEFGFSTEYVSADVTEAIAPEEDNEEDLIPRPPIVTVMGHVDHGKTSLLDYIRNANVIAGEAGGITQHIGAYNVKLSDGRHITFLDTPGHEAFTAMRARGAKVTDLAIIIVAADDDVMPQTIEAINHASAAGVPMVFAINKIDKPTANPDKIKEQLAAMNYLVEEWGGKYQSQDISAKKGIGVDELMEKVLLEAELLDLKANPDRLAIGSVIESSLDKGRGYVATVLVQNGTLKVGDVILAGTHYGKIKAMFNERNQRITEAGPSTPVLILGLNGAPTAGDTFNVLETEQEAREIAAKREQLQRELGLRTKKRPGLEELGRRRALNDFHELNLVVKGDVDGSVEALSDSLIKLSTPEIQVNVLHKGVGAISESDVTLAAASDAIIIGFQVRPSGAARKEAEKEGVEIRLYSVIYKAIEEVKDAMEGLLAPEIKEEITGTAEVLQTYHISKVGTIAGAIVRDGKIKRTSKVRVIRDGIVIYTGELGSLKRFKDDVKDVVSGYDCGLSVQGYNDIREGDMIEAYEEVEVKKSL